MALLCSLTHGSTPTIDISLVHGTAAESETRDQLQRLLLNRNGTGCVFPVALRENSSASYLFAWLRFPDRAATGSFHACFL